MCLWYPGVLYLLDPMFCIPVNLVLCASDTLVYCTSETCDPGIMYLACTCILYRWYLMCHTSVTLVLYASETLMLSSFDSPCVILLWPWYCVPLVPWCSIPLTPSVLHLQARSWGVEVWPHLSIPPGSTLRSGGMASSRSAQCSTSSTLATAPPTYRIQPTYW